MKRLIDVPRTLDRELYTFLMQVKLYSEDLDKRVAALEKEVEELKRRP